MTRSGIAAGGNWIVDRVKSIDHYPAPETLVNILSESHQNGGAPFNVLIDLAKLGASFPLEGIGLIGDDADGEFIRDLCREHGIQDSQIRTLAGSQTSYTDVMSDSKSGRRTFFHNRGASAALSPEHFDFEQAHVKHFHLGYLLLLNGLDVPDRDFGTAAGRVLAMAQQAGLTTSIDVVSEDSNRFREIVLPGLPYVNIAFMNEFELGKVTGLPITPGARRDILVEACSLLFEAGLQDMAAIHTSEQGFVSLRNGPDFARPCAPVDGIAGTVGAGDAFAAGFLFAYHEGLPPEECLRWATAAAASSLLGDGASNGVLPIADALDRFARE